MRHSCTLLLLIALGCGDAPAPEIAPVVRFDGLLADEVLELSLYVFDDKRTDGIVLTCSNLLQEVITPKDTKVVTLASLVVPFTPTTPREARLQNVAAGPRRVVFAEARGAGNLLLGRGCAEASVGEGEVATVQLTVFRVP